MSAETFDERRTYSSVPFLKITEQPFRIKTGNLLPDLKVLVLQRQNEWGDPLPFDLTGFTIKFNLYDSSNRLITQGPATVTNVDTGEITFSWRELDIATSGVSSGEFEFINNQGKKMILPTPRNRLQIVAF